MGSPSRNVQYHPPRLSEDRLNLPQPHSPSLPTHCTAPGNRECAQLESCLSLLICDNPSHASSSLCAPSRTRAIPSGDTPARRARTAVIQVATGSGEPGKQVLASVRRAGRVGCADGVSLPVRQACESLRADAPLHGHSGGSAGVELVPGDSIVFIDILEDSVADGFNDLEFYGEWYPTLSFGRLADRTVGGGPVRDVALIGGINFDGDATDSFMFDVSSGAVSISRASRSGSPRQPIAAGTWVDPGQRAGGGRLGEPCI